MVPKRGAYRRGRRGGPERARDERESVSLTHCQVVRERRIDANWSSASSPSMRAEMVCTGSESSTSASADTSCEARGRMHAVWCHALRTSPSHTRGIVLGIGGRSDRTTLSLMSNGW